MGRGRGRDIVVQFKSNLYVIKNVHSQVPLHADSLAPAHIALCSTLTADSYLLVILWGLILELLGKDFKQTTPKPSCA